MATSPLTLLSKAKGRSLTAIAKQGVGGWILAVSTSFILGVQTLTTLLLLPVNIIIDVSDAAADAILIKPLTVIITGSEATAASVAQFELFGLPLGTGIVLGTFGMVGLYLRRPSTSDFLPGTFTDSWFTGVQEEDPGAEG